MYHQGCLCNHLLAQITAAIVAAIALQKREPPVKPKVSVDHSSVLVKHRSIHILALPPLLLGRVKAHVLEQQLEQFW